MEKLNYLFQGYWQENVTWYIYFFFTKMFQQMKWKIKRNSANKSFWSVSAVIRKRKKNNFPAFFCNVMIHNYSRSFLNWSILLLYLFLFSFFFGSWIKWKRVIVKWRGKKPKSWHTCSSSIGFTLSLGTRSKSRSKVSTPVKATFRGLFVLILICYWLESFFFSLSLCWFALRSDNDRSFFFFFSN